MDKLDLPQSTLTKRHNAINYHVIRESVAADIFKVTKVHSSDNLADVFTKVMGAQQRSELLSRIIYSSMFSKGDRFAENGDNSVISKRRKREQRY